VIYGLAGGRSAGVAIVLLVVAELAHVGGELLQAPGSWGYGYGLAPDDLQGQYQGLFSMSYSISSMLAPVIVTSVVIAGGFFGWLLIGLMFLVVGIALGPLGRWAEANRPARGAVMQGL
jgi:hypothetical protein